jgi:hypothetical protein
VKNSPTPIFEKINAKLFCRIKYHKKLTASSRFKKLLKENKCPIDENSPNLVTLVDDRFLITTFHALRQQSGWHYYAIC